MDLASMKRKAGAHTDESTPSKKAKAKKQWTTPRRQGGDSAGEVHVRREIQAGDAGVWASCVLGKEGKVVGDLRVLFEEHAQTLYGTSQTAAEEVTKGTRDADVEAEIEEELLDMRQPASEPLFTSIKVDTPCLIFFKTRAPVEPESFVRSICEDIRRNPDHLHIRSVKRLTPMSLIGKATEKGLREVAQQVLAPHFHTDGSSEKKFAIRPNIRNHSILTRDSVIQLVAQAVGPGHKVDLKQFDLLILVEVYKNICGMSVVGGDFDTKMRRYNLDELSNSADKAPPEQSHSSSTTDGQR